MHYNRRLRDLGLKDHQIERATTQRKLRNLVLLIYRSGLLLAWAILALPGVITHAPIFIPAKMYSKVKAKGKLHMRSLRLLGLTRFRTYRGFGCVRRKDRCARRHRYLEDPLLPRCYPCTLHHLRSTRYLACMEERCFPYACQVNASHHFRGHAFLRYEFAQIWRGRNGRFQVTTFLS
jgi:hypothetical protein